MKRSLETGIAGLRPKADPRAASPFRACVAIVASGHPRQLCRRLHARRHGQAQNPRRRMADGRGNRSRLVGRQRRLHGRRLGQYFAAVPRQRARVGKNDVGDCRNVGLELQKLFGLPDRPSASVELAQYRPIYLAGEIQTPGEYPFAPDMTVLKAVSLGGGLRRAENGQRFARDFINAKGESSVRSAERNRLLVRRARLQAEIAEKRTSPCRRN